MIEAKDILFFVLAFCALWFTLFLSWLIWQVANILRNVNDVITETKEKLSLIEKALTGMREKVDVAVHAFSFVGRGLEKVFEIAIDKRANKKGKKGD